MKKIMKILIATCTALLFFAQLATPAYAAASGGVTISAFDTVAHFDTLVKIEGLASKAEADVTVKKPSGENSIVAGVADQEGAAQITVSGNQLIIAGTYEVILTSSTTPAASTQFQVFPGDMSPESSALYPNVTSVAADSVSAALISVRVVDTYSNPLQFHEMRLTSNRSSDEVIARSPETNSQGLAFFLVKSRSAGISTLTAFDESASTPITKRVQLNFVAPSHEVRKDIGGDPQMVLLAALGQNVASFLIDNLPATTTVNQAISFRVSAVDAQNAPVPAYTGTVTFSSTDPNIQVPADYTFLPGDQGRKTFDLGLTFRTVGTQKLTVKEKGSDLLMGEKSITVQSAVGGGEGAVRITKPATGTYSVNTLEIAGEAMPSSKVKLFDNGQQIAEVQVNGQGRFSFKTSLLPDGAHAFHAESNGVQSDAVTVTIDSTPAQVDQVNIETKSLRPGDTTNITVRSDKDLNSVQATVGDSIIDLKPDPQNPGVYVGVLTAPKVNGDYTVNVVLTDKVGNVAPAVEVGKIHVDSTLQDTTQQQASFSVPGKIQNVQSVPGNGRITLTWSPAASDTGIAMYRIYYGTDLTSLNSVVNTTDAKTTWYVPNLRNETPYYFQVVGIDTKGNEGDNRSNAVSAAASSSLPVVTVNGATGGSPVLCDPSPCESAGYPPVTSQDGPEVMGMILAALASAGALRFIRKRRR